MPATAQTVQINGAGATFPYPIYSKWFSEYNKLHPDVEINYQSIGSGGGIRQLSNQTVFFGATDGPMTRTSSSRPPGRSCTCRPCSARSCPIYNIPGVDGSSSSRARCSPTSSWARSRSGTTPAIAGLNPGVKLPATDITVAHRSDGSGTTYIFVDYLSKVSPEFKKKVGVATSVNWPVGVGGKGNEGVAGLVKQTPGSIGYVELIYAKQNKIDYGSVQNMDGEFVNASLESVTAAAAAAAKAMPEGLPRLDHQRAGQGRLPDLLVHVAPPLREPRATRSSSKIMVDFMKWALTDGQKFAADLGYAPLPPEVVALEMEALKRITI